VNGRNDRLYEEATALWRSLYGEPPPRGADAERLLDLIVDRLPEQAYARLSSPYLRPGAVTFPRPPAKA
jgi:hypothetical protein